MVRICLRCGRAKFECYCQEPKYVDLSKPGVFITDEDLELAPEQCERYLYEPKDADDDEFDPAYEVEVDDEDGWVNASLPPSNIKVNSDEEFEEFLDDLMEQDEFFEGTDD